MGNDDELTGPDTLQVLHDELEHFRPVAVAVTNYREIESGRVDRRIVETKLLGHGPRVAARTFRNYSFVSGVVLQGDAARKAAADVCDGSEMYQMYLGTRLVAEEDAISESTASASIKISRSRVMLSIATASSQGFVRAPSWKGVFRWEGSLRLSPLA